MSELRVNWWLGVVGPHGYATELADGPHEDRAGVEKAAYLIENLGLTRGRKFVCVQCIETDVTPSSKGVNKAAVQTLQSIGLMPAAANAKEGQS